MEFRQFEELVFESMLKDDVPHEELRDYARQQYFEMRRLMAYYRCAIMEIETKCNVINEDFSYRYERNPIQSIKSRLKTPQSIFDKLKRLSDQRSLHRSQSFRCRRRTCHLFLCR